MKESRRTTPGEELQEKYSRRKIPGEELQKKDFRRRMSGEKDPGRRTPRENSRRRISLNGL